MDTTQPSYQSLFLQVHRKQLQVVQGIPEDPLIENMFGRGLFQMRQRCQFFPAELPVFFVANPEGLHDFHNRLSLTKKCLKIVQGNRPDSNHEM